MRDDCRPTASSALEADALPTNHEEADSRCCDWRGKCNSFIFCQMLKPSELLGMTPKQLVCSGPVGKCNRWLWKDGKQMEERGYPRRRRPPRLGTWSNARGEREGPGTTKARFKEA